MIIDLTKLIGDYMPDILRNGIDAIDIAYVFRGMVLLLTLWFFYRLILNFCNSLFK